MIEDRRKIEASSDMTGIEGIPLNIIELELIAEK